MEVCKVLLLTILEILLVHSAYILKQEDPQRDNWNKHKERLKAIGFNCAIPQPRSFSYKDFVNISALPDINSNVIPTMTVLHRCDSQAGCCQNKSKECTRKEYKNVTLTFQIVTIMADKSVKRYYESVIAKNHTECECAFTNNKPK